MGDSRQFLDGMKDRNGKWQDLVERMFEKYDAIKASKYRQMKIKNAVEAARVYHQIKNKTDFPFKDASNMEAPLFTITVDNIEPRLVAGLTGKSPIIEIVPNGMTEKNGYEKALEDWFNRELIETVKVARTARTIVHRGLMEGTVYPVVDYEEDEETRRDFVFQDVQVGQNPETGEPIMGKEIVVDEETGEAQTEDKTDNIFRGGRIRFADFTDVFVDDFAEDWETTDVIRIVRPTYGELVQARDSDKPGYKNIGPWLLGEQGDGFKKGDENQSPSDEVLNADIMANETIECLECCVSYVMKKKDQDDADVKDWKPVRYIALIAKESQTIIRIIPLIDVNWKNQHLVKRVRMFPEDGKAYGSSMFEKIQGIQEGCTTALNTVVNAGFLTMMPWFLYTESSGWDDEVVLSMGKGVKVDDVNGVQFPKFNQNPMSALKLVEVYFSMWERSGSIGDIQTGKINDSSSDTTATETLAAIQEGNIKHNYQTSSIKEDFIEVLRSVWDMYYQKMPYKAVFKYQGKPVEIPRQFMRRRYEFKLTGTTDASNQVIEMKKTESFYGMLKDNPFANQMKTLSDVVESHKPDSNPKDYINPQLMQMFQIIQQFPELAQQIMQYPQKQQMQEQQGEQQKQQQEIQLQSAKGKQDIDIKGQKAQQDAQIKAQKAQQDQAIKMSNAELDLVIKHKQALQDERMKKQTERTKA